MVAAATAVETPLKTEPVESTVTGNERFRVGLRTFPARTPLTEIPVYQLEVALSDAEIAVKALSSEIDRLYVHAKTLASGANRRALETRIYNLEKRLRPLTGSFNIPTWEALRADVGKEWSVILASFAPVAKATPTTTGTTTVD